MRKQSELTGCELVTMKCIWDADQPISCRQIRRKLREVYEMDYQDTTVYTFLKNLKTKGFIDCFKDGPTYYTPIRQEEEYRREELKKLNKFWFQGSSVDFIAELLQSQKLSKEEKAALKKLVAGLR